MSKAFISRITLFFILSPAIIFISGCPSMTLVYPELIQYNTFALSKQWAGKYVTTVVVFDETANSKPSTEPVWMIKATEQVPAEQLIVRVGFTPNGFEQIVPVLPQEFEPVDGQKYYISVKLEPAEEDMFFVLRPWIASSISEISPPEEEDQPYIHPASKMEFPKYVGFFMRGQINRYDEAGKDISVAYYLPPVSGVTTTTVYISPAIDPKNKPVDLKMHYDTIKETIRAHYYKSKIISDSEIQIRQNDKTYQGFCVTFSMTKQTVRESPTAVFSKLYLFKHGNWFIKYRFTYPQNSKDYIEKEINKFLESLIWPDLD